MSRFYYGCVLSDIPPDMYGTASIERNFICDDHPAVILANRARHVITFYQEISEDMYVLLDNQGHIKLNEISATDTI